MKVILNIFTSIILVGFALVSFDSSAQNDSIQKKSTGFEIFYMLDQTWTSNVRRREGMGKWIELFARHKRQWHVGSRLHWLQTF